VADTHRKESHAK